MGDKDGSSNAAQRALSLNDKHKDIGFFGRIIEALTPSNNPDKGQVNGHAVPAVTTLGILNLRRLRVEDVAIPKADLIAVL